MSCFRFPFASCESIKLEPRPSSTLPVVNTFHYLDAGFIHQMKGFVKAGQRVDIFFETQAVKLSDARRNSLLMTLRGGVGQVRKPYLDMATDLAQLLAEALPETALWLVTPSQMLYDFPVEALGMFPTATKLTLRNFSHARSVLGYLNERRTNELSGEEEWPCPNLKELDLREAEGLPVAEIRGCVKARWVKWKEPATATGLA